MTFSAADFLAWIRACQSVDLLKQLSREIKVRRNDLNAARSGDAPHLLMPHVLPTGGRVGQATEAHSSTPVGTVAGPGRVGAAVVPDEAGKKAAKQETKAAAQPAAR